MSQLLSDLKKLAPYLFPHGKLDKTLLYEALDLEEYDFTWKGRKKAQNEASTPSKRQLKRKTETTKHDDIFIRGDNLEALKLLLASHKEQVDLIYIDPPYNTGNDGFIYNV